MINNLLKISFTGKELDIYEASFSLFAKYGISKVTITELCQEANVSKMTFYKYFKNKQELVLKFVKIVFEGLKENSLKILNDESTDSIKRLSMIALEERKGLNDLGDELLNSILTYPEAQEYFEKFREDTWLITKKFIQQKQVEGVLNPNFRPDLLKYFIAKMWEMIADPEVIDLYTNFDEMMSEITEILYSGILSREKSNKAII